MSQQAAATVSKGLGGSEPRVGVRGDDGDERMMMMMMTFLQLTPEVTEL